MAQRVFSRIISGCNAGQTSLLHKASTCFQKLLHPFSYFKHSLKPRRCRRKPAPQAKNKAKQMRKVLGELEPTVRKFVLELLQATYPGFDYSPKHIPGHVYATWLKAVKKFCQNCMLAFPSPVLLRARIGDIIWHRRNILKKAKSKPAIDPVTKMPVIDLSYFKLGDELKNFLAVAIPETLPDENSVESDELEVLKQKIRSLEEIKKRRKEEKKKEKEKQLKKKAKKAAGGDVDEPADAVEDQEREEGEEDHDEERDGDDEEEEDEDNEDEEDEDEDQAVIPSTQPVKKKKAPRKRAAKRTPSKSSKKKAN